MRTAFRIVQKRQQDEAFARCNRFGLVNMGAGKNYPASSRGPVALIAVFREDKVATLISFVQIQRKGETPAGCLRT